jgi:lipopolysaccharide transport system ATP-binding protein
MPTAIKFENISKQYRLGLVSTRTLSHDLNRWWQMNILRKEDPYLKIGEVNDRAHKGTSEYVWALKNINFEVEQGDVVGIIGKNGAGKSTLLKILSKVTTPTTGTIKARGRIASLLEVGTGFHPEMTGRENIYMNGAIMGMTSNDINRKFDEIVDFAGVERYIDTPVKRYSSGMTVRLGFAVAAFLEPEILVVDEVLAVGDAEFQKKAIGKMKDVSKGEGRTVLFVSHNMGSIASLCQTAICLENGTLSDQGQASRVIASYINTNHKQSAPNIGLIQIDNSFVNISDFTLYQIQDITTDTFCQGWPFQCQFHVSNKSAFCYSLECNIEIKTGQGEAVTCFGNEFQNLPLTLDAYSSKKIMFKIDELLFKQGLYYTSLYFKITRQNIVSEKYIEDAFKFTVDAPSAIYLQDTKRNWKIFPQQYQHGNLNQKIDSCTFYDL